MNSGTSKFFSWTFVSHKKTNSGHKTGPPKISLISILDRLDPFLSIFSTFLPLFFICSLLLSNPFYLQILKKKLILKFVFSRLKLSLNRFFWMWKSKYLYFLVIFLVKKKFSNNDMIITVLKSYCDTFEQFETLRRQLTNAHFWLVDSTSEDSIKSRISIESSLKPILWKLACYLKSSW